MSRGVSFDLFGTLVDAERPTDPAAAVATELRERGVAVPEDWAAAYGEPHVDAPPGAEVPLPAHVAAALRSRGVDPGGEDQAVRRAVVAAFDPAVTTRSGAAEAVAAARERGPVAVLSNCSVPGLVRKALIRSALPREFDAVVTSAACGWRKPDPRAFETVAERLGIGVGALLHVGDSEVDGGIEQAGGRAVLLSETGLRELPAREGWV